MNKISKSLGYASRVQSFSLQKPIDEKLGEIIGEKWVEYRKQWKRVSSTELETDFPLFVLFENQFACNLKCKMCIHGYEDTKETYKYKGKLDYKIYCNLIDECVEHNCPSICLNNINEPLLENDIFSRIEYASKKGIIDIHMNTNATLLTKDKSEMILESGLTRLLIGLDGFNKQEYEGIRIGADYDIVVENINTLLELKKKKQNKLPVIRISLVYQKDNVSNLEGFVRNWLGKADYVSIQKFYPFDSHYSKKVKVAEKKTKRKYKNFCTAPWERVTIQGDGAVLPCCSQTARPLNMGNIHMSTIYDIWNSSVMRDFRRKHKKLDIKDLPVCQKCLG